jgi:hypothetical protein
MRIICVAGYQNFGRKKRKEYDVECRTIVSNSDEDQGLHRTAEPMMMMMMMVMVMVMVMVVLK